MTSNTRHLLTLLLCLFISSCSSRARQPGPDSERILCVMQPLRDLTGSYGAVTPPIETLIALEMAGDYVVYPGSYRPSGTTLFLGNIFTMAQTPSVSFSPAELDRSDADILITGTVERISYGTPSEVAGNGVVYLLFGFAGLLALGAESEVVRSASVAYKFDVFDLRQGTMVHSMIVKGSAHRAVKNRELIVREANINAAEQLVFRMNSEVAQLLGRTPHKHKVVGRAEEPYASAVSGY